MIRDLPTASTRPSVFRPSLLKVAVFACLATGSAVADEPPRAVLSDPVLNLRDGGFLVGSLADQDRSGVIRWKSPSFANPLEFAVENVQSIRFPSPEILGRSTGSFGFELTGGDTVYGTILSLDAERAEIEAARLGRIVVERSRLRRIFRWRDGSDLVYNGPNGLAGWVEIPTGRPRVARPASNAAKVANPAKIPIAQGRVEEAMIVPMAGPLPPKPKVTSALPVDSSLWVEEAGQILTNQEGASIQTNVHLPDRAKIEIELSWKDTPDFLVALGVSEGDDPTDRPFRLEVWDGQLVATRSLEKEADLAVIEPIAKGPGRLNLHLYLDQEQGKLLVYSAGGEPRAELKLGGRRGPWPSSLRFTNLHGDLRLERISVGRWDGATPRPIGPDPSRVQLTDLSMARGPLERFDPKTHEFVIKGESGEIRIAEDKVLNLFLAQPDANPRRSVLAMYQDGTRLGGDLVKVEGGSMILESPGIAGPIRLPREGLRALEVLARSDQPIARPPLTGTLEIDGLRLVGRLVATVEREGQGGLAWLPLAGLTSSPIGPRVSGKIIYKAMPGTSPSSKAEQQAAAQNRANAERRALALQNARLRANPGVAMIAADPMPASSNLPAGPDRKTLYLRSGDVIPAEIVSIDEKGVTIQSDTSPGRFIPHAKIKAVEMASESPAAIRLNKTKVDRLLMLPRLQRDSPPTQLIRSKNGDILRARILAMDDRTIRVEVRLEEKEIPRDRVSRIIWLHADETDPSKKVIEPPQAVVDDRIQAIKSDGIRLTFNAKRFVDDALIGQSDVLGECQVRIKDVDQVLLGGSVEKVSTQLAYQNWKLQNAPDPRAMREDDDGSPGGGAAGTDSALVGKLAPDFELELLDGKPFHLADAKGTVIVLDFWATWCGPCLQAMPQIEKVTGEFADKGVRLIAVNLQETPAKIRALLERQKLSPTVALDRDGVVAQRYAANAIPQTVVIDREGKVTRLFIGGGTKLGDQLRDALNELMPNEKP